MEQNVLQIYLYRKPNIKKEACFLEAAKQYLSMLGEPIESLVVEKKRGGKPFLADVPAVQFSITHSADMWACAFFSTPVGLDIQVHKPLKKEITRRFFHPQEVAFIENTPNHEKAFFEVWAAKESYVKYTGAGITSAYAQFSTVEQGKIKSRIGDIWLTKIEIEDGYSSFMCADTPEYTLIKM